MKPLDNIGDSAWKHSEGAQKHLKAGYCLMLLSEAARIPLWKRPEACGGRPEAFEGRLLPNVAF